VRNTRRRRTAELLGTEADEDSRYCVLCETVMLFERLDPDDDCVPAEWVCVTCGSAVFVDPPAQADLDLDRTA
jgi:hypothetical protein